MLCFSFLLLWLLFLLLRFCERTPNSHRLHCVVFAIYFFNSSRHKSIQRRNSQQIIIYIHKERRQVEAKKKREKWKMVVVGCYYYCYCCCYCYSSETYNFTRLTHNAVKKQMSVYLSLNSLRAYLSYMVCDARACVCVCVCANACLNTWNTRHSSAAKPENKNHLCWRMDLTFSFDINFDFWYVKNGWIVYRDTFTPPIHST